MHSSAISHCYLESTCICKGWTSPYKYQILCPPFTRVGRPASPPGKWESQGESNRLLWQPASSTLLGHAPVPTTTKTVHFHCLNSAVTARVQKYSRGNYTSSFHWLKMRPIHTPPVRYLHYTSKQVNPITRTKII